MITPEQVKQFQSAVGSAAWQLDLWSFADAVGSEASHNWTQEKFRQLITLNKAVAAFDPETLARVINAAEGK